LISFDQALKDSQTKQSEYRSEMKTLQEKLAVATTQLAAKRGQKGPCQCTTTPLTYAEILQPLAKKFAMTEELWLEGNVFDLLNSTTLDPRSLARFANAATYDQGTAVILHKVVPEIYHEDMANMSEFRRAVLEHVY
jgi:hypothetical protein